MTTEQQTKLARIQRYATRYELVLEHDGARYLVQYTSQRSRRGLLASARTMADHIVRIAGGDEITFASRAADGAMVNGWKLHFSGRTQRECILAGELPFVAEKRAA